MNVESFVLSDVGRVRRENQDSNGCFREHRLFVVADGMGGHAGGAHASRLAVATIGERFGSAAAPVAGAAAERALVAAIGEANQRIVEQASRETSLQGMGTTLVALLVDEHSATIVHVGDSRAYLVRDGSVRPLTADHSVVADLLRNRDISEAEARVHPYRHVLTRALGVANEVTPEISRIDLRDADLFLLCSDGVSGMIPPDELQRFLLAHRDDPAELCRRLINAANDAGGRDNATALAVRVTARP
jgi:PPM family protein phosphatase